MQRHGRNEERGEEEAIWVNTVKVHDILEGKCLCETHNYVQ